MCLDMSKRRTLRSSSMFHSPSADRVRGYASYIERMLNRPILHDRRHVHQDPSYNIVVLLLADSAGVAIGLCIRSTSCCYRCLKSSDLIDWIRTFIVWSGPVPLVVSSEAKKEELKKSRLRPILYTRQKWRKREKRHVCEGGYDKETTVHGREKNVGCLHPPYPRPTYPRTCPRRLGVVCAALLEQRQSRPESTPNGGCSKLCPVFQQWSPVPFTVVVDASRSSARTCLNQVTASSFLLHSSMNTSSAFMTISCHSTASRVCVIQSTAIA